MGISGITERQERHIIAILSAFTRTGEAVRTIPEILTNCDTESD